MCVKLLCTPTFAPQTLKSTAARLTCQKQPLLRTGKVGPAGFIIYMRQVEKRICWEHLLNRTEQSSSNGPFPHDASLGQPLAVVKNTLLAQLSPVPDGVCTDRTTRLVHISHQAAS